MGRFGLFGMICARGKNQSLGQFSQSSQNMNSNSTNVEVAVETNFLITGLNAMQIMKERQSKKIKELKKEVNAVRLKGRSC